MVTPTPSDLIGFLELKIRATLKMFAKYFVSGKLPYPVGKQPLGSSSVERAIVRLLYANKGQAFTGTKYSMH